MIVNQTWTIGQFPSMETLPDDCINKILGELPLNSLLSSLSVCKLWEQIGKHITMREIVKCIHDDEFGDLELENHLWYHFLQFINKHTLKSIHIALSYSAYFGRIEFIRPLIKAGADVNRGSDSTALHEAVRNNHLEIVTILLDHGAELEKEDMWHGTALTYANNRSMIELLISRGAKIHSKVLHGKPLSLDVIRCYKEHGIDMNVVDSRGRTPLMNACVYNDYEYVRILMEYGASIHVSNSNGETPIMLAVMYGDWNMVEHLLKAGADINSRDINGMTPLVYLSSLKKGKHDGRVRTMRERDILNAERLIEAGADLNARDNIGATALMYACRRGNVRVVRKLLDAGADISIQDNQKQTVYRYANQSHDKDEIVKMLPDV